MWVTSLGVPASDLAYCEIASASAGLPCCHQYLPAPVIAFPLSSVDSSPDEPALTLP